jgi:hypothetical protein
MILGLELKRGLPIELKFLIVMPNLWYCTIGSPLFSMWEHRNVTVSMKIARNP